MCPKQRVGLRLSYFRKPGPPFRIACFKFFHEVLPLECKLATRNNDVAGSPGATDFLGRKTVTADHCLSVNNSQILSDKTDWRRLLLKPSKLGVVDVSNRPSPQHGLGKKSLPPQCNQPAGVKVLRVQAPDSHCRR